MTSAQRAPVGAVPDLLETADLDLAITGMTCASCANRIERKLNKLEGVTATVNYATERAHVRHAPDVSRERLLDTVTAALEAAK